MAWIDLVTKGVRIIEGPLYRTTICRYIFLQLIAILALFIQMYPTEKRHRSTKET